MVDQLNEEAGEQWPEEAERSAPLDPSGPTEGESSPAAEIAVAPEDRAALLAAVPEVVEAFGPEQVSLPVSPEPDGDADTVGEPPATEDSGEAAAVLPEAGEPDGETVEPELEAAEGEHAPAETASQDAAGIAFPETGARGASIWPFVAYDVVWLAFAGVVVWQLQQVPVGLAVYDSAAYPLTLIGGLVLTVAGPLLILASWLAERGRAEVTSGQVFLSSLVRGSVSTLLGVTLWWAALLVLDQLRLGRLF